MKHVDFNERLLVLPPSPMARSLPPCTLSVAVVETEDVTPRVVLKQSSTHQESMALMRTELQLVRSRLSEQDGKVRRAEKQNHIQGSGSEIAC